MLLWGRFVRGGGVMVLCSGAPVLPRCSLEPASIPHRDDEENAFVFRVHADTHGGKHLTLEGSSVCPPYLNPQAMTSRGIFHNLVLLICPAVRSSSLVEIRTNQ